jgi:uncharacterized protein
MGRPSRNWPSVKGTRARNQPRPVRAAELLVGGGSYVDPADRATQRFVFSQADFGSGEIALTATTFLPHGIAIDPNDANRLVTFQKIGLGCCEIDLATRKVMRTIVPTEGRWFYGHGAFSSDGKLLYSTETVNSEERGVIGVRDAATFEYLGEFPTFGENPHDCHLIEDGKVLLVTNGGGALDSQLRPCVTWVEIDSHKLLDKRELDSERFNTGHLCLAVDGGLAVVSAPRKGLTDKDVGAVSLGRTHDHLQTMQEPRPVTSRMYGEALSVAIHEPTQIAAVTHPFGDMVTFWSMRTFDFLKKLELPRARGVTLTQDGRNFIVSYGPTTDVVEIAPGTLAPARDSMLTQSYLSGSHIFNWTRMTGRALPVAI